MKKVLKLSMLMLLITSLTGCSFNIGGHEVNLGGSPSATQEPMEQPVVDETTTVETVASGMVYEIGAIINAVDVITTDPNKVPATVAFMFNGTDVVSSITCDEVGEFSVDVVVQYEDLSSWGGVFTYTVEGKDLNAMFPQSLADKIINSDWDKNITLKVLPDVGSDKMNDSSYTFSVVSGYADFRYDGITLELSNTFDRDKWSLSIYPKSLVESYKAEGCDVLTNSLSEYALKSVLSLMDSAITPETTEEERIQIQRNKDYMLAYFKEHIVVYQNGETGAYIYDTEGNAYPVEAIVHNTHNTAFGGTSSCEEVQVFYVDLGDEYLIIQPIYVTGESSSISSPEESASNLDIIFPEGFPETYEEFRNTLISHSEYRMYEPGASSISEDYAGVQRLSENMILGDVTPLLPVEVVEVPDAEVPEQSESGDENEIQVDTSVSSFTAHKDRFPSLYTAFPKENGLTYSRWIKIIGEDTNYIGTIFDAAGNVVEVKTDSEQEDDENYVSGWGSGNSTDKPTYDYQSFELSSVNGNYLIFNDLDVKQSVLTSQSTSNKVVCKVYNELCYVSISNRTNVDYLIENCMFDTNMFLNGNYDIWLYNTDMNDLGYIEYYKIKYVDAATEETTTGGYLAVISVDDQYIIVKPDKPVSMSVLEHTALNMIKRSE